MGLLTTIFVGLLAGLLASIIMKIETGILIHLILGVAGSFLGGWISKWITGINLFTGINLRSILISLGGSIIVIILYRIIKRHYAYN